MAVRYIPPSKNVGDSVHDINYNFDYLDTHIEDVLQAAEDYADGRDAEFLAVSADYAEEKALQAQQAAQAYADSLVYTHPAYTARDVNKVSGTQQITPGTPFTLAWFSVDNTGHVYQSGSSYFNIEPYVHPTYAEKDIGRETGVKQLNPGTTFTLPWVHVDNKGHVSQSGSSTYNISHDADKVDTSAFETYQETINTSIGEIGADIDDINSDISTLSTGKANKVHSHSEYLEKTGGTLEEDAEITIPRASDNRKTLLTASGTVIYTPTSGWSSGINYKTNDGEIVLGNISAYGTNGTLAYYYMGQIFNNPDFKFIPETKTIEALNFTGNSATATKLQTARTINGVEFDGSANITHFEFCSTAAATVEKVVPCTGFKLVTGARIAVYFSISNTANNITLNVNSTGAKPVYYNNTAMTYDTLRLRTGIVYEFVYTGSRYCYVGNQHYTGQYNNTDNASYRLLFSGSANDTTETYITRKSANFTANPSTGVITAKEFKHSASGTLLADTSANANSVAITNAEIAKYSQIYMSASWTERETVDFCDIIPVADVIAGAVFTRTTNTGTRRYTYTVTCTSAGLFTLTQSNSTGTAGTLRLKLYVI